MSTADLKTFKARGDGGSGRTELLTAFAALAVQWGMQVEMVEKDHHLIITSTKVQRERLWKSNQARNGA